MSDAEMRAPRPAPVSGAEQGTSKAPVPYEALTRPDEQERYVVASVRLPAANQAQGVGHASSRDGPGLAARTYRAAAVDRIRHDQYGACAI